MFYAIPTARVIFMAKTILDAFSLRRAHVSMFSVLCEMKRVTVRTAWDQNLETIFAVLKPSW